MFLKFKNINKRRLTATVLCAIILMFISTTLIFMHLEADHDCTGEDCQICTVISECQVIINYIGKIIPVLVVAALINYTFYKGLPLVVYYFKEFNLVDYKIRMNN